MGNEIEIRGQRSDEPRKVHIEDAEFTDVSSDHSFVAFIKQLAKDAFRFVSIGLVLIIGLLLLLEPPAQSDAEAAAELAANVAEADRINAEADRIAAQAEAEFEGPVADLRSYAIADDGSACENEHTDRLLSEAMHGYMMSFLTQPRPGLAAFDRVMPPMQPADANQLLSEADIAWVTQPEQTTWDIFGDEMYIQCEGTLELNMPSPAANGSAMTFQLRPLEWAVIFATDFSGDPRVMIHDRTEEYGSSILLEVDGNFVPLGRIVDAR
ncbi:MAG: hypothetical protein GW854_13715 [Erythrobacter sp.]|nr:hypothetical protein [Erythrobacter sp.]